MVIRRDTHRAIGAAAFVSALILGLIAGAAFALDPDAVRGTVSKREPAPTVEPSVRQSEAAEARRRAAARTSRGPLYKEFPPHTVIVGDVDGKYILTRAELEKRVRMMLPENRGGTMDDFEREKQDRQRVRLEGEQLEEWAVLKTLVHMAEKEGLKVTDGEVDKALADLMKQGVENGQDDKGSQGSRTRAMGMSQDELREQVRDALLIDRFIVRSVERDFTDAQLKKIYEAAPQNYAQPPGHRVRQIFRRVDPAMSNAEKKDLRSDFYKLRKKAARRDGRDFEKFAREESDYPGAKDSAGDMGWIDFSLPMDENLSKAIRELEIGEVSQILETEAGWHIIRVEERRAARGAQWDAYARKRVIDRLMFDLKGRMGPSLLRNAPFSVRLNASGLRLVTDPVPTPRPASLRSAPRRALQEESLDEEPNRSHRRKTERRGVQRR